MQYYEAIYARLMIEATEEESAAKYCPEAVRKYELTRLQPTDKYWPVGHTLCIHINIAITENNDENSDEQ